MSWARAGYPWFLLSLSFILAITSGMSAFRGQSDGCSACRHIVAALQNALIVKVHDAGGGFRGLHQLSSVSTVGESRSSGRAGCDKTTGNH